MIVLNNGDKVQGDSTTASKTDYSLYGLKNNVLTQLANGQLPNSIGDLYTAASADVVSVIVLVNTNTTTESVNLYMLPSGGTARRLIAKNLQLQAGYSLHFDGKSVQVLTAAGGVVFGSDVDDTAYAASWDAVTTIAPSKNAVYDQMQLQMLKTGSNLAIGSDADGDTYYRTGGVLARLAKGAAGQVATMNAGATAPGWEGGAWVSPSYSAGNFTAGGSMTWTVDIGDITTYAYQIIGKTMTVVFFITATTVAGTPAINLIIAVPASKVATKTISNTLYYSDNGTIGAGLVSITAAGTSINLYKSGFSNWTGATNTTAVYGELTFEIN